MCCAVAAKIRSSPMIFILILLTAILAAAFTWNYRIYTTGRDFIKTDDVHVILAKTIIMTLGLRRISGLAGRGCGSNGPPYRSIDQATCSIPAEICRIANRSLESDPKVRIKLHVSVDEALSSFYSGGSVGSVVVVPVKVAGKVRFLSMLFKLSDISESWPDSEMETGKSFDYSGNTTNVPSARRVHKK